MKCPALIFARDMRRQIIHRQLMQMLIALPAGAAFFQPHIAAGDIAFIDGHPTFETKARALQGDVVLHPAPEPGFNVDVVGL